MDTIKQFDDLEITFIEHYGVKGMKWGVRRDQKALDNAAGRTPRRTNRKAKKDAKETARAKMFYGEGAGTRRKLQKAKVNSRMNDPKYKAAYEKHLSNQDLGKHASKAKRERRRKNVKNTTTKTGRGLINIVNGNKQAASALAVTVATGAFALHKAGVTDMLLSKGKTSYSNVKNSRQMADAKEAYRAWQYNRAAK